MTTETRICKKCERPFEARVVTGVVHCRECRKARAEGAGAKRVKAHREVEHAGRVCTAGPFATTGERCGKTAMFAFEVVETGEVFAECAAHFGGAV